MGLASHDKLLTVAQSGEPSYAPKTSCSLAPFPACSDACKCSDKDLVTYADTFVTNGGTAGREVKCDLNRRNRLEGMEPLSTSIIKSVSGILDVFAIN